MYALDDHENQKKVWNPLKLVVLWTVVNHHVDAQNQIQVFCKMNKSSLSWAVPSDSVEKN